MQISFDQLIITSKIYSLFSLDLFGLNLYFYKILVTYTSKNLKMYRFNIEKLPNRLGISKSLTSKKKTGLD